MHKWFCLKKNANAQSPNTTSTTSTTNIPSSLESELDKLNITEERLKRYVDEANVPSSITITTDTEKKNDTKLRDKAALLREKAVSKTLDNIKRYMSVDICFVLDCTGSMGSHIAAAKDSILQVSNYVKSMNPNIKFRVGFCGYHDHSNGIDRLKIFDFTESYEKFKVNLLRNRPKAVSSTRKDGTIPVIIQMRLRPYFLSVNMITGKH